MAIRFLTAGESHGPMLSAIIEGLPAGLEITPEYINTQLRRRQQGFGSGGRMRIEKDQVQITAGVINGKTTGAPVALLVFNRDYKNWQGREIEPMTIPRPGHADLTGTIKYGYGDLRLALERASARETTMRVAVGAICRRFLEEFDIQIGGYVVQIGSVRAEMPAKFKLPDLFKQAELSTVRCPVPEYDQLMEGEIRGAMKAGDTVGGVFEIFALNIPPGLGSYVHYDRRLDARYTRNDDKYSCNQRG